MARPSHVGISSGLEGWDGEIDDNFDLVFSTPIPIAIYDDFASLPAAASYEDCLAVIVDEDVLCISDGSNWKRIGVAPPSYANFAGLPAAASHTDEIAVIQDLDVLVVSDGSNWKIIGTQAADIVALTGDPGGAATDTLAMSTVTARTYGGSGTPGNHAAIPDPADTPVSADALRDDLVANVLPVIRDSIATLAAQMIEITTSGGLQEDVRDNLRALMVKVNTIRTNLRATDLMA